MTKRTTIRPGEDIADYWRRVHREQMDWEEVDDAPDGPSHARAFWTGIAVDLWLAVVIVAALGGIGWVWATT